MAVTRLYTPRPYDSFDPGIAGVAAIVATGTDVDNTKLTAVQAAAAAAGLGTLPTSAGGTAPTPTSAVLRFRGPWQANTAYQYGDVIQIVDGSGNTLAYSANLNFTSGSTFNATNWTELTYPGGSAASGAGLPATIVSKTTAYTAAVSDFVECDTTSAGFTVTLPSAPAAGSLVAVKKISNDTNTLTIAAAGSGTIDGQTTVTTITQWAGVILEHKGSDVWRIAASMTTTGPAGTNGNTVLTTSGAPSSGTGQNGDYAIDPTAHVIYGPKAAGAWPSGVNMLGAITGVQAAGVDQTVRAKLNFTGTSVTITDDAGNGRTNIAIAGGGGGGGLLPRALRSGGYAAQPGQSTTLSNPSSGYTYVFPFEFFASTSVAAMGINVSTAFAAATIRVGVYSDSSGMPGSLLFEAAGTPTYPLDAGTTGDKMVTLSSPQVIAAGVYWVAFRATTGGSIAVAGTQNAPVVISAFSSAGANQNQCSGYADGGGGAGALNSSLTGLNHQVTVPRVYFKIT